jgi:hypothetical protein
VVDGPRPERVRRRRGRLAHGRVGAQRDQAVEVAIGQATHAPGGLGRAEAQADRADLRDTIGDGQPERVPALGRTGQQDFVEFGAYRTTRNAPRMNGWIRQKYV